MNKNLVYLALAAGAFYLWQQQKQSTAAPDTSTPRVSTSDIVRATVEKVTPWGDVEW